MKQQQALIIGLLIAFADICLAGELQFAMNTRYLTVGDTPVELYGISVIHYESECTDNDKNWQCGEAAHDALSQILRQDEKPVCISADSKPVDEGRLVQVECFIGTHNLNAKLVTEGWALTATTPGAPYRNEELVAKNNKKGVFRGGFIPPVTWRPNGDLATEGCSICAARHQSFRRVKENLKRNRHSLDASK